MPAARTSTESNKSFIIAVVIFVVLFLASAVAAIILYRERESNIQDRDKAVNKLDKIASPAEASSIKPLVDRPGVSRRATAVGELTKDVLFIADKILGQDQAPTDLLALRDEVAGKYQPVEEALNTMAMEPKIDPAIGLASIAQNLIRQIEQLQDQIFTKDNQISQMDSQHRQDLDARNTQIAQLQKQLDDEQRKAQIHETEYQNLGKKLEARYVAEINDLQQQIASLGEQLKQAQDDISKMNDEIKKYQVHVKQLNDRLIVFQQKPDDVTPLEPDGYIVNIDEREKLAYINLAKGDQMYRGLKFSVYDRFRRIPKSGQGKGAIEVIEIMDTISKCRITVFDASNPIMTNDIIANLVWNKDKKYNFCVAGDFDFDSDGLVDQDGLQKITELIKHWGGQVTPTLSVDTDFLVLGWPPAIPTKPSDEYGADSPIMQTYMQASQRLKEYKETIENGKALDVPTFNLSRFFYFIGFFEQAKTAK